MSRNSLIVLALALVGCGKTDRADRGGQETAELRMADSIVATVTGFDTPESVLHDVAHDVYLVSNINGNPSTRDNNGYIARLKTDGAVDSMHFIQGGRGGVTLHAPKGMALNGDSLWVADIDAVRIFNAATGATIGSVDFSPQHAVFLNDIARAPDGSIYVTDTGIRITGNATEHPGPDRVFRIGLGGEVSVVLQGDTLRQPNGIAWDSSGNRLLIAPLGGTNVLAWSPGDSAPSVVVHGPGGYDGIEVQRGGRFVVSSWDSSGVYLYDGTSLRAIATGLSSAADIGMDRRRRRLLIPFLTENKVEIRLLPR